MKKDEFPVWAILLSFFIILGCAWLTLDTMANQRSEIKNPMYIEVFKVKP